MGDIIILAGLAVCVFFAVRALKRNTKKGGVCCSNCARCKDGCHRL